MSIRLRRVLYITAFMAFFVAGPLITLYASGYRVKPGSLKVQQVGAFYIKSYPSDAEVLLDGESYGKRTPARFLNVTPGFHTITIQKNDLSPWTKELEVVSSQTTFVRDAILFRSRPATEIIHSGGTSPIKSLSGSLIAYVNSLGNVDIVNTETDNTFTITTPRPLDRLYDMSPSNEYLLGSAGSSMYSININTERAIEIASITSKIKSAQFINGDHLNAIVTTDENELLRIHEQGISVERDNVIDAMINGKTLYLLTDEDSGTKLTAIDNYLTDGTTVFEEVIALSSDSQSLYSLPSTNWSLIVDGDTLHLIDLQKQLVTRLHGSLYDWHDNKLVHSTPTETNYLFVESGLSELLDRSSDETSLVRWHTSGSYIARVRGTSIELIELDDRGMRNVTVIADNKKPVDIFFGPKGEQLYVLTETALERYAIQ